MFFTFSEKKTKKTSKHCLHNVPKFLNTYLMISYLLMQLTFVTCKLHYKGIKTGVKCLKYGKQQVFSFKILTHIKKIQKHLLSSRFKI